MTWLLLALAGYLALAGFIGYKRGFSKMLISVLAVGLSVLLTWAFAPRVKDLIVTHTEWDETLADRVGETVLITVEDDEEVENLIFEAPFPASFKELVRSYIETRPAGATKKSALSGIIAGALLSVFVSISFFILCMILLTILGKILDLVNKIPGFKQVNGALGAALALVEAAVFLELFFLVLLLFCNTETGQYLLTEIQKSTVLSWLYEHNLFLYLFEILKNHLLQG